MRETIRVVIIGHVDHGKSTLIGRLLLDTNSLPKETLREIKGISRELGKDTELAYLADQLKEEREHNITIDTTQIFLNTKKRRYCIIDAPGHVEFIKNMITGASLAQAAILIVDAKEGIMEQTRRHAYLIDMLGLNSVVVVFNKMDLVGYNREEFDNAKRELLGFLDKLNIRPSSIIPISAKQGANISKRSTRIDWYKGPSLVNALNSLEVMLKTKDRPLRFPIQDVYERDGERILVGRVASGVIREGEKAILFPSGNRVRIDSIRVFGKQKTKAQEGENIGVVLDKRVFAKRGDIILHENDSPRLTNRFKAKIFWMSSEPLRVNATKILRCATQEVKCIAERVERRIDSSTLEIIEEDSKELRLNEVGIASFKTERPILMERISFIEELGRFVMGHDHNVEGAGIISEGQTL